MSSSKNSPELLPDGAIVVRGGQNNPAQIRRSLVPVKGSDNEATLSVICASDLPLERLCRFIPHEYVRCTTVGAVRMAGGNVIVSNGRSPYHAMLICVRSNDNQWASELFDGHSGSQLVQKQREPMATSPRVFADFQNADRLGRIRLNTVGAVEDLARSGIELVDGMSLELYDDEIVALGVARHDDDEGWVAEIDWNAIG